jgi:enamine deaminase RidA (YjgF/YER057c/UK114 family)
MGAQIRQVGENLKAALVAAGATLADLVRTQTFAPTSVIFSTTGGTRAVVVLGERDSYRAKSLIARPCAL